MSPAILVYSIVGWVEVRKPFG